MEWLVIIGAAILLVLSNIEGRKAGKKDAQREAADEILRIKEGQIDEEVATMRTGDTVDQFRALIRKYLSRDGDRLER